MDWFIFRYKYLLFIALFHLYNLAQCQVPLNEFFPFNDKETTSNVMGRCDDCSTPEIPLQVPFFLFNHSHNSLWLNNNGGISFVQPISQFTPSCTPQRQDFRMITPFWADVDTRNEGVVYFRQATDKSTLDQASEEIRTAFPAFQKLQLAWAFVATWKDVRGYGLQTQTNTFQAVLTTDLQQAFVIFYYNKIEWTKGSASGNVHAKIGFDAGDGNPDHMYMFNSSCTPDISNVTSQSNYGKPGKFVFRVDQNSIISTGCDIQWDSNQRLTTIPAYVSLYGNEIIQFKGPCFKESDQVNCIFQDKLKGSLRVNGSVINEDTVACTPPFFYQIGRVEVQVVVTDIQGISRSYNGILYILEQPKHFLEIQEIQSSPAKVQLKWDSILMKTEKVDLILHRYDKNREEWIAPITIENDILNTGEYLVEKSSILNLVSQFNVYTISLTTEGSFEVQNFNQGSSRHKRSVSMLGILTRALFVKVPVALAVIQLIQTTSCAVWYSLDNGPPNDLLSCPPTLTQAAADIRFEEDNFLTGFYHKGADTCYRSVSPSPSGGGQQCCYKYDPNSSNENKSGKIYCRPPGGGTADRYSPKTAFWRHLAYDVAPWFACCPFTFSCDKYYKQRPSDCGDNYQPPGRTRGNGDPHFTTFDGMEYTFNGHGEYWMMRTDNCSVQVRMIPFNNSPNATVISAIAFKCQSSDVVLQIQLSPLRTSLTILLDSQPYSLDSEMNILNVDKIEVAQLSGGLRVSFEESTFLVALGQEALSVEGSGCNGSYPKKIQGLLGNCDKDRNNDLQTPDGLFLNSNSSLSDIHFKFGEKWRIRSTETFFTYNRGESYSTFDHPEFTPTFYEPDPQSFSKEIQDVCGDSKSCYFDYSVTKSLTFANQTKVYEVEFKAQLVEDTKTVIMCSPGNEIRNGYRLYNNYFPGSTVQTICHDGYILRGKEEAVCTESGQWSNPLPSCENNSSQVKFSLWLGLLVPACLFFVLRLFYV
jgi:hypothetical protein